MLPFFRRAAARRRSSRRPVRLSVQRLEPRYACAGIVTATLQGNVLTLTGDAAANGLDIQTVGNGLMVNGMDPGTGPTVISHQGQMMPGLIIIDGGALDLRVNLAAGFDAVLVGSRGVRGLSRTGVRSLEVNLGEGTGILGVDGLEVAGNMTVVSGTGTDFVRMLATHVAGNLAVYGDSGADSIDVTGNVIIDGSMTVDAGYGNDTISVRDQVGVGGALDIFGRPDDDIVSIGQGVLVNGPLTVDLGLGTDQLRIADMVGTRANISILGRAGNDTVTMERDVAALGALTIDMGIDDDRVTCAERVAVGGAAVVQFGAGATDRLEAASLTVGTDASIFKPSGVLYFFTSLPMGVGEPGFRVGRDLRVEALGGMAAVVSVRVGGNMTVVATGAIGSEITVGQSRIGGGLSVTTGAGADGIVVGRTSVGGGLNIATAGQRDSVRFTDDSVAGRVSVALGLDDDFVSVSGLLAAAVTLDGQGGVGDEVVLQNQPILPALLGFEHVTRA